MGRRLFAIFFKIGLFTLGGGPAMIPIVQSEVVDKQKLITAQDFLDCVGFSAGLPGAIIINISVFVGNKIAGIRGAVLSALGAVLPAYFSMIILATAFNAISEQPVIQAIFKGIRPTVIVLIGVSVYNLVKSTEYDRYSPFFVIGSLIALLGFDLSAVLVVITAGTAGLIWYTWKERGHAQ